MSERYEDTLLRIYDDLTAALAVHGTHATSTLTERRCPQCGSTSVDGGRTCGVDDRCDPALELMGSIIDGAFPDADAESWLADGPPDLLDWTDSDGGSSSLRDYIMRCLITEAWARILPDNALVPVHPSTTRPQEGA